MISAIPKAGINIGGNRENPKQWYAIDADMESGKLITAFNSMDNKMQSRLMGYAEALMEHMKK